MLFVKGIFCYILVNWAIVSPHINLHLTDSILRPTCLRLVSPIEKETDPQQIIIYCLADQPSEHLIQPNTLDHTFTFDQLQQQSVTIEQLLHWSASFDLIEHYQLYLDERRSDLGGKMFYNCTSPRFGPLCQYSFADCDAHHYRAEDDPEEMTCYTHLQCDRGSKWSCLDWSEICDGYVDCSNGGVDEQDCWMLDVSECEANEYRCENGQCISQTFAHDDVDTYECLDRSDEMHDTLRNVQSDSLSPTFATEDIVCPFRHHPFDPRVTSSCVTKRNVLLKRNMVLDTPLGMSESCWIAMKCHIGILYPTDGRCVDLCSGMKCQKTINETCPEMIIMPAGSMLFGHIYLAYLRDALKQNSGWHQPHYVCYNDELCDGFLPNRTLLKTSHGTCRRPEDFPLRFLPDRKAGWVDTYVRSLYMQLYHCKTILHGSAVMCDSPNMYRCINSSKCIAIHRICDGLFDCDYKDDEQCSMVNDTCPAIGTPTLFKCSSTKQCISSTRVSNGRCDCVNEEYDSCDDEVSPIDSIRRHISFGIICDGFTELIPVLIDGRNETDETSCEHWPCNNIYTRCDAFWNCWDGADEIGCPSTIPVKCPSDHHLCLSPETSQLMCLPRAKANDGRIDCWGGTDEVKLCRSNSHQESLANVYCGNDTSPPCSLFPSLCYEEKQCGFEKTAFSSGTARNETKPVTICRKELNSVRSDAQQFLGERPRDSTKPKVVHFSLGGRKSPKPTPNTTGHLQQRCHRGLPLQLWLDVDRNISRSTYFCPPTHYGDHCQHQNQRITLTLRLQTFSDSRRTLFSLFVSLIDDTDQRLIHSSEQLLYLYTRHCQRKFNLYLLYSSRPKHPSRNYSIHVDVYEKISLVYRGSFFLAVKYPFLPVTRLAVELNIPRTNDPVETYSDLRCGLHGQCVRYLNDDGGSGRFCQCHRGWWGKFCQVRSPCTCPSAAVCLGVSGDHNRSICLCPLNRWGDGCRLPNLACQSSAQKISCHNGGQCLPTSDQMLSEEGFICLCPKGFSGERCEQVDTRISLSFDRTMVLPPSVLVHFIEVIDDWPPENGSTFRNIPMHQRAIVVQWSRPFHVMFVEFVNSDYYFVLAQKTCNRSSISRTVRPSDRCKHLTEVLNETIFRSHLLQRIKSYHLPCQDDEGLPCFYDETHFCLCTEDQETGERLANCFEFNRTIQHDCFGQSNCENGAQCLQDRGTCPQTSICVCPECFYGTRCQFTSNLFGLSLDAILGDSIQPHIPLFDQPSIVKMSILIASILIFAGFLNGILSLVTFLSAETRTVGCGIYLLGSAIITLIAVSMFSVKFCILIVAQMTYVKNRSFLFVQCLSIDFLLRTCLIVDRWLNACVAMDRSIATLTGVKFNKNLSKKLSKYIIALLMLLAIGTNIQDPIHRRLLEEPDDERIWCIVTYSQTFQKFDRTSEMFHFFTPFLINIIATLLMTVVGAQRRLHLERDQNYHQLLLKQFQRHRHLLIAPIVLVLLALPRLIISFVSGCLKSAADSWLFLLGYFISIVPSMLGFVIFVLPSHLYKEEFRKSIQRYRRTIMKRIQNQS